MHFFNPVSRIPLVEVIRSPLSSDVTVATVFALAKRLGKTPVVVKDSPGFLVNRILAPYLSEAVRLVKDGCPIEEVDRVLTDFGMPVGPLALLDDIGLDVAVKARRSPAGGVSGPDEGRRRRGPRRGRTAREEAEAASTTTRTGKRAGTVQPRLRVLGARPEGLPHLRRRIERASSS